MDIEQLNKAKPYLIGCVIGMIVSYLISRDIIVAVIGLFPIAGLISIYKVINEQKQKQRLPKK